MKSANAAIWHEVQQAKLAKKLKAYTPYADEQSSAIGTYASKHTAVINLSNLKY